MAETIAAKIARLKPRERHKKAVMTDVEAKACIEAIRRGVRVSDLDDASEQARGTLYTRLGRWAMYRCTCFAKVRP